MITTTEAAALTGKAERTIRKWAKNHAGEVGAKKFGRDWLVDSEKVLAFSKTPLPVGRPPTK